MPLVLPECPVYNDDLPPLIFCLVLFFSRLLVCFFFLYFFS